MPTAPRKKPLPRRVTLPKSRRLTEPARKLLEKALTAMVRMPRTVNMANWYAHDEDVKPKPSVPEGFCGTVACLAGHVVLAAGDKPTAKYPGSTGWYVGNDSIHTIAVRRLNINVDEADKLFYPGEWPIKFFKPKEDGNDLKRMERIKPATIVARVRHWVRTGE